jgi:hypothetical protein
MCSRGAAQVRQIGQDSRGILMRCRPRRLQLGRGVAGEPEKDRHLLGAQLLQAQASCSAAELLARHPPRGTTRCRTGAPSAGLAAVLLPQLATRPSRHAGWQGPLRSQASWLLLWGPTAEWRRCPMCPPHWAPSPRPPMPALWAWRKRRRGRGRGCWRRACARSPR